LTSYGVTVVPYTSARSLGISYLTGVILTFISVGGAALYASKLNIIAAIRDLPPEDRGGLRGAVIALRSRLSRIGQSGASLIGRSVTALTSMVSFLLEMFVWFVQRGPGLLFIAVAVRYTALNARDWNWFAIAITLAAIAILRIVQPVLKLLPGWLYRALLSIVPLLLLLFWLQKIDFLGAGRWPYADPGISAYALRSLAIVLLSIWLTALLLPLAARVVSVVMSPAGTLLPAVRIALIYPSMRPWRSAFAMGMFAQVVFTMVLSAILLNVALNAYGDPAKTQLGYDIRGEPATTGAPPDVRSGFTDAAAIKASDFTAIGTLLTAPADILNLSTPASAWSTGSLYTFDKDFLDGIPLRLDEWSQNYASSDDAWAAIRTQPGLALISSQTLGNDGDTFKQPFAVWIRDPRGGKPEKLTVIGALSSASGIPAGVVTAATSVPDIQTEVRSYFFKVRPDMRVEEADLGLSLSFGDAGLRTQIVGEEARRAAAIRSILTYLLEVFLAMGLIAGLAALGILGVMAVVERRSQIGVMRAIGYRRWLVVTSFVIESMVIAGLGIAVGAVGGIVVAREISLFLAKGRPEIRFDIPFGDLGIILLVAFVAALITAALPALQAGRIPPSEAIKAGS
jgi:putative ABC transport system permease protein